MPWRMARERRQLGAYLSPVAADGWKQFAADHGCTVSALVEAVGLQLANLAPDARLPEFWREAIKQAREISADRRAREHERP